MLDDFSFVLFLATEYEVGGTHDGERFVTAARASGVDVLITERVDVRRSRRPQLIEAATAGRLVGGTVTAFVVHTL